jgi:hypothetical protein
MAVVIQLADTGNVGTLLEAAAHSSPDFRHHASRALEELGAPCTAAAIAAATSKAGTDGLAWFTGRAAWKGAPSWRIDLWGAIAALNPGFGQDGTSDIPKLIGQFGNKANQKTAKAKLIEAGSTAVYPLIAALGDQDPGVADHAADLLGELGDRRAIQPLMGGLGKKVAGGGPLSDSPFYSALQKFDDPGSEPLLLKIRPNAMRAMHIFERQYQGARAISAESRDTTSHHSQPIRFRIGFIDGREMDGLQITFMKNGAGDWIPTPPLPAKLPSQN